MKLNQIADRPGSRKKRMRIGRGIGSGMGKTGGRGGKGQTARSGVRIKGFEGGQMPLHRRLPKRGFNNIFALDLTEVNLGNIQAAIDAGKLKAGDDMDAAALVNAGVLRRSRDGVRLLGNGELKSKITISVHGASKSAVAAVEKAGGTVKILAPAKEAKAPRGKNAQRAAAEAAGEKPKAAAAEADAPKAEKKAKEPKAQKPEKPKA
jgi:large subunit ribosomal protein L15